METIHIIDYTFAFAQFLKEHPEETIHKNSAVYVFEINGQPIETIFRSLN